MLYDYRCTKCGHEFEDERTVEKRHTSKCPECGKKAKKVILRAPDLDPRLGVSPDFPSMARKWERKQRMKAAGKIRDHNNTAYGTDDEQMDRDAFAQRKILDS